MKGIDHFLRISLLMLLMGLSAMGQHPTLVSINSAGTGTGGLGSFKQRMSTDGRFVAFQSAASDLVTNDTNGSKPDVFVRDRTAGTTTLVSINSAGTGSGDGDSLNPVISSDGKFIVFESLAANLATTDSNGKKDVFLRDQLAHTTKLISINKDGTDSGGDDSLDPVISKDDKHVAFTSFASDIVAHDTNGTFGQDVFVRNLDTDTTTLVSINKAGTATGDNASFNPVISDDGRCCPWHAENGSAQDR